MRISEAMLKACSPDRFICYLNENNEIVEKHEFAQILDNEDVLERVNGKYYCKPENLAITKFCIAREMPIQGVQFISRIVKLQR